MNFICKYDEAYTKSEAEDIGFWGRCRIPTCVNNIISNKTDLKEKLIVALVKELGTGNGRPKRIRNVVEKIL